MVTQNVPTRACKGCKNRFPIKDYSVQPQRERWTCKTCATLDPKWKDKVASQENYISIHGKPPGLEWRYDPTWKTSESNESE